MTPQVNNSRFHLYNYTQSYVIKQIMCIIKQIWVITYYTKSKNKVAFQQNYATANQIFS